MGPDMGFKGFGIGGAHMCAGDLKCGSCTTHEDFCRASRSIYAHSPTVGQLHIDSVRNEIVTFWKLQGSVSFCQRLLNRFRVIGDAVPSGSEISHIAHGFLPFWCLVICSIRHHIQRIVLCQAGPFRRTGRFSVASGESW